MAVYGRDGTRGVALVLVASLLSLLTILAAGFLYTSRSSSAVSRSHADRVRAALLARSGVEYASARLTADLDPRPGATRAAARDDWTCRDGLSVRLEQAHNPSYAHGEPYVDGGVRNGRYDKPPSADTFTSALHERNGDGVHTGWTGRLRGVAQVEGDTFSLKIALEEGKIYVNGGDLDAIDRADPVPNGVPDHRDPDIGYNAVLRRILNRLGANPLVGEASLGDRVIAARPVGGYRSLGDLYGLAGVVGKDLSPYLTCRSWVDPSVIRPNAAPSQMNIDVDGPAEIKEQRGAAPIPAPGGRAPVNVNVAEKPVIEALLVDICGAMQVPGGAYVNSTYTRLRQMSTSPIPQSQAAAVAQRIAEARAGREDLNRNGFLDAGEDADADGYLDAPFRTWSQFAVFCETLVAKGVVQGTFPAWWNHKAHGDAILANANPNSDLNDNIPDRILWRDVDKADLLVYSTEFSLHPMAGDFTVESLGITRDVRGGPTATARVLVEARMFLPVRQTTQADFVAGRAAPADYVSPAVHAGVAPSFRTHGAARGYGGAPGIGLSLVTYPEPLPAVAAGRAADYDGQIALATTEAPADPDPAGAMFVHRFTDRWEPDTGIGGLDPIPMTDISGRESAGEIQTSPSASAWDATRPGTLYPDGTHAQAGRIPMFASVGSLPAFHGVISYWVKEGIEPGVVNPHVSINGALASAHTIGWYLCIGRSGGMYGLLIEDAPAPSDPRHERTPYCNGTSYMAVDRRWSLLTGGWDMEDVSVSGQPWFRIDGRIHRTASTIERYPDPFGGTPQPQASSARRLLIGGVRPWVGHSSCWVNAVIDEVCVFDYGPGGLAAKGQSDPMAQERYRDGRYYKRNDGTFTSSDLRATLPAGAVTLERVYRTEVLPRGISADPDLRDARIRLEVLSGPAGAQTVVYDSEAFAPLDYGASADARHAAAGTGPLRYRATFMPTPNWDPAWYMDRPVLETPYLDDVTLLLRPPGYPLRLRWSE